MLISRNKGKREYETQRIVTWERDALALNGFHEHVLHSSRYPLIGLTCNLNLRERFPFPRAGHKFYFCNSDTS